MSKIKEIYYKYNLVNKLSIKKDRSRLKNKDITILSSNCTGGLVYHDLGLQFLSPTVNLSIDSPDFVKMVSNLKYYMSLDPVEFVDERYECPCGMIGDIEVHFTHYKTFEEGRNKWNERKKRINYDNIYVITNDNDGLTEDDINILENCVVKNAVVLTSKDFTSSIACKIDIFEGEKELGNLMKKDPINARCLFWKYFDMVGFLNSSGEPAKAYKK